MAPLLIHAQVFIIKHSCDLIIALCYCNNNKMETADHDPVPEGRGYVPSYTVRYRGSQQAEHRVSVHVSIVALL